MGSVYNSHFGNCGPFHVKNGKRKLFVRNFFFHKTNIFSLQFLMRLNLSEVAVIMFKKQSEKNYSLEKC